MNLVDQAIYEQHLEDEEYRNQAKRELAEMSRAALVEWARSIGPNVLIATYGAVNGAWDDVCKDLRRNRITLAQATEVVNQFEAHGLITENQARWYKQRFAQTVDASL